MLRLAINGYGRIGRCVLRALYEIPLRDTLEIVAINELADARTVEHLSKYDSTHGRFPGSISRVGETLNVNGDEISLLHRASIEELPWAKLDVDVVLEIDEIGSEMGWYGNV